MRLDQNGVTHRGQFPPPPLPLPSYTRSTCYEQPFRCISRQLWWGHRIPAYFATAEGEKGVDKVGCLPRRCVCRLEFRVLFWREFVEEVCFF